MRVFFLFASSLLWLGIWLTGFSQASWVLYLPTIGFLFAALTGICPSLIISNRLFGRGGQTCSN
jgi:hypothetical protein